MSAIRMQMGGKQAAILVGARPFARTQQHRAGAIAKQYAGAAISPIQDAGIDLSADHQHVAGMARAHHRLSDGEPIDKASAGCGNIKGKARPGANLGLPARRSGGESRD